jgi:hypothetical protein
VLCSLTNTIKQAVLPPTRHPVSSVFPWAKFRKRKAAVKMHTLLDLHGNIPTFISITDGKVHDVNILDEILPEAGAFYVMDRGYVDFGRHQRGRMARYIRPYQARGLQAGIRRPR